MWVQGLDPQGQDPSAGQYTSRGTMYTDVCVMETFGILQCTTCAAVSIGS